MTQQMWFRTKLATGFVFISAAILAFAISSGFIAPCNTVLAQSTSCNAGDTETFAGPTTFQDEINVGATPGPGSSGYEAMISQGADSPPEWQPVPRVVFKAADETVNNSTTLQADDDITFAVEANSLYAIDGVLFFNSNGTADFKFNWSEPSGTTIDGWVISDSITPGIGLFNEGTVEVLQGITADQAVGFSAVIDTDSTAASVTLFWAQNTADVSDTILRAGTWLRYHKLE